MKNVLDGEKVEGVHTNTPTEWHSKYVTLWVGSNMRPRVYRLSVDVIAEMLKYFVFETKETWGYDRLIKPHPKGRDETDLMLMKHKLIKSAT